MHYSCPNHDEAIMVNFKLDKLFTGLASFHDSKRGKRRRR